MQGHLTRGAVGSGPYLWCHLRTRAEADVARRQNIAGEQSCPAEAGRRWQKIDRQWESAAEAGRRLEETTEDRQRGVLDLEQKPMVGDDRRLISSWRRHDAIWQKMSFYIVPSFFFCLLKWTPSWRSNWFLLYEILFFSLFLYLAKCGVRVRHLLMVFLVLCLFVTGVRRWIMRMRSRNMAVNLIFFMSKVLLPWITS